METTGFHFCETNMQNLPLLNAEFIVFSSCVCRQVTEYCFDTLGLPWNRKYNFVILILRISYEILYLESSMNSG